MIKALREGFEYLKCTDGMIMVEQNVYVSGHYLVFTPLLWIFRQTFMTGCQTIVTAIS